ncbi:MAG: hypothetical protein ACFFAY_15670 [Promethearchaeota archaeon]
MWAYRPGLVLFPRACLGCGTTDSSAIHKEYKPFLTIRFGRTTYSVKPALFLCRMCQDEADLQIKLARDAIHRMPMNKIMTGIVIGVLFSIILAAVALQVSPLEHLLMGVAFSIPVTYCLFDLPARNALEKWVEKEWFKPYGRFMTYSGTQFGFSSLAYLDRFRKANTGTHSDDKGKTYRYTPITSYELGCLNNSPHFEVRDGISVLVPNNKDSIRVFSVTWAVLFSLSSIMLFISSINPPLFPVITSLAVLLTVIVAITNLVNGARESQPKRHDSGKRKTAKPEYEFISCLHCGYDKNSADANACKRCNKPLRGSRWKACQKCGYYFNEPDSTLCLCGEPL